MEPEKSLLQSFHDVSNDLKGFIETRYEIARAELGSGLKKAQAAVVLLMAAAVFAVVGLVLLGMCVSFAIGLAFGAFANETGLVWGFLVTGAGNLMLAGILSAAGKARMKTVDLVPERTLRVLERDKEALQQRGGEYGERDRAAEQERRRA